MSWFLPDKKGDHDLKVGVQWQYSQSRNDTQDKLNGTFSFGLNDIAFNTGNPRTYPERFTIRVPGKGGSFNKSNYFAAFVQDKWKLNNQLTLSLGLRYDLEVIAINEIDNPLFGSPSDYPVDKNNFQPRVGIAYDVDGKQRHSRRLRPVLRQDALRVDRRHLHGDGVRDFVQPEFPVEQFRSGTTQRPAPDRPVPGQRPGDHR